MTDQKSLKRRVRGRMSKTGERYTAARRQVLAKQEPAVPQASGGVHAISDDVLRARTGHSWDEWYRILEAWGARERPHPDIARWVNSEHGVDGWWAQEVTVGYERASGRRLPGQHADGFSVSATKTVGVPVERLFAAFMDDGLRQRWLPDVRLGVRTATPPRTARFDWQDGASRVVVGFTVKGDSRSMVAIAHERLPDADAAAAMKAFWRERVAALKSVLEE